jgi:hypothetical protein
LLAVGLARSGIRRHVMFRTGAALLALSYPGVLVAWHASPMEVERHALHSVMLARLGFVFWIVAMLDRTGGAGRAGGLLSRLRRLLRS